MFLFSCNNTRKQEDVTSKTNNQHPTNIVKLSSEIDWEQLNPARGDQSPQAGTIWGDRKANVSTGFLAKFVDGFSSPPHIHNVTYRAVVIKGLVHNDDPEAETMWMKPVSFWTQPAGESHITSAKGNEVIALVEINEGPYLVKPIEEAYDNGEKPVNIDASNITWLTNKETNWIDKKSNAKISFLLKNDEFKSLFIKLPKGYQGEIITESSVLHSVIIAGELNYEMPINNEQKMLDAGSCFGASNKAIHKISCDTEVVIYIRTNGNVFVKG